MEVFLPKAEVFASVLKSSFLSIHQQGKARLSLSRPTPRAPAPTDAQPLTSFQTQLTFSTRMRSPTWMFELLTFTVPAKQQTHHHLGPDRVDSTRQQGPRVPTSCSASPGGHLPVAAVLQRKPISNLQRIRRTKPLQSVTYLF